MKIPKKTIDSIEQALRHYDIYREDLGAGKDYTAGGGFCASAWVRAVERYLSTAVAEVTDVFSECYRKPPRPLYVTLGSLYMTKSTFYRYRLLLIEGVWQELAAMDKERVSYDG